MIYYTWTFIGFLAEIFELAEDFHGGEADCKELVNPYGLYDNSLLMGAPPHMAILLG